MEKRLLVDVSRIGYALLVSVAFWAGVRKADGGGRTGGESETERLRLWVGRRDLGEELAKGGR